MEKMNVLVIDEDEDILNWFRTIEKKDSPYHFHFLHHDQGLQKVLDELRPDLIFSNLTESGKTLNLREQIPVVYMSTKELGESGIKGQPFMRKPLERKAVEAKIRSILKID